MLAQLEPARDTNPRGDEAGRRRKELDDRHRPWRPLTLAGLLDGSLWPGRAP
jgi:hypothetical protein